MENTVKFYMNNPCIVIREIANGEFVEIKINPRFTESLEASSFCMGCMLGAMDGAHPSHTCEEAEVIMEAINDEQAAIVVMAESRLVHDLPVQFAKYKELQEGLTASQMKLTAAQKLTTNEKLEIGVLESKKKNLDVEYAAISKAIAKQEQYLEALDSDVKREQQRYAESLTLKSGDISISGEELKKLYRTKYIMEKLEQGGLRSWEWYSESYPEEEAIEAYANQAIGGK